MNFGKQCKRLPISCSDCVKNPKTCKDLETDEEYDERMSNEATYDSLTEGGYGSG